MARKTITTQIVETLEDLGKDNVERFRERLIDRREEPRVRRCIVEDKSPAGIANVMVTIFTEDGALKVTLEVLRKIYCYKLAMDLESNTQTCVYKGDPIFPRTPDGRLDLSPSQEALKVQRNPPNIPHIRGLHKNSSPEDIKSLATASAIAKGLDPYEHRVILSEHYNLTITYPYRTFKWMLENDVGYVVKTVSQHQIEKEDLLKDQIALMANKDALAEYAKAYSEVAELIRLHIQKFRQDNRTSRTANHQLHLHYIQQETIMEGL